MAGPFAMTSFWLSIQPLAHVAPRVVLVAAAIVFPLLFFVPAPYGRHFRPGWGPALGSTVGSIAMEWPSVFLFALVWVANPAFGRPMVLTLGLLWLVHYVQRTFVFSLLLRGPGRRQSLLTVALANVFNVLNATGNAAALTPRPFDAVFLVGVTLFALGFGLNVHSDRVLRSLRAPGETGYRIPFGGGFAYVSAPNYLGGDPRVARLRARGADAGRVGVRRVHLRQSGAAGPLEPPMVPRRGFPTIRCVDGRSSRSSGDDDPVPRSRLPPAAARPARVLHPHPR